VSAQHAAITEQPIRGGSEEYWDCVEFLVAEAAALDENRAEDWLEMLHPEIDYRVPIRVTRERTAGPGFTDDAYHLFETYNTLALRVERLSGDYAWAEDPPSRTRRLVANFRVTRPANADDLRVRSNLLIYRERLDDRDYQLISAERHDDLRMMQGRRRLVRRLVLLDHTTLMTPNVGIFL
jgi:3-phenylpropionate/cinnamic acid dioxygenase small subunit